MPSLATTTVGIDLRSEADSWFADVCGLSTIVRLLCALQHAGVNSVLIAGEQAGKAADAFKKHPLARRAGDGALVPQCVSEFPEEGDLLFRSPVVLSSATIKALVSANITEVPETLPDGLPGFLVSAKSADERRVATNAVLGSVGKPMLNSGIASVYLLQPIAKVLNRPLSHTPITPNQVTILGFLLGLASLPLLWNGGRNEVLLAVSLLLVANVLDQIDGQLARIKFLFSSYGEKLDHHLDGIIKVLLLAPIGAGLAHNTGHEAWAYLGWVAASAQLFYILAMIYYVQRFGGKDASSNNFKFWYSIKPRGSVHEPAPAPENPNTFKRRFLLRKDFAHTLLFVFGAANFIEAPFMLITSGAILYGSISLVQLVLFHHKVQIAGDYYGGV